MRRDTTPESPATADSPNGYSSEELPTTHHTDSTFYLGDVFNNITGSIEMWLGLQAIILNLLVIAFYYKSYKKIVPFMYVVIAICDVMTGVSAVIVAVIFLV